jgi:peptidyl-prolyl cis-trans isomerase D
MLEANGLSEQAFVFKERQGLIRQAITSSLDSGLAAPNTLVEIAWRQRNEQRDASYFDIPASAVSVPEPSADEIAKYYKDNQADFMIPERRTIALFVLDVPSIAKSITVSDKELQTTYERDKNRFGTPEKRDVQQIAFPSMTEAEAALKRIRAGEDFMKIASERGLSPKDVSLGDVLQTDIPDEAVANAAFSLKQGEVSEPVKGKLSVALVRVTKISPGAIKTLAQVRDQLIKEITTRHARERLLDMHDHIEDQRAAGTSFEQIAKDNDLKLMILDNVDSQGHLPDGKEVASFPGKPQILKAAFESDIGLENDAVAIGQDAYGWYEVRGEEPAKAKPLAEARNDVIAAWKARKLRELLLAKARALQARAEKGEAFDRLATEVGAEIKQASGLKRNESTAGFPPADVAALFATAPDGFASVIGSDGKTARVMHSTPVMIPPFDPASVEAKRLSEALDKGLSNDVLTGYLRELQAAVGVKVNQDLWRRVSGSSS